MNRNTNKQRVRAMDKLANQLMQRNIDALIANYEKSKERGIMTFEEYARVHFAQGGVSLHAQIIRNVLNDYDNSDEKKTMSFREFCDYLKDLGNKKLGIKEVNEVKSGST